MINRPYAQFGNHLKKIRRQVGESIVEVSGAVEIDTKLLVKLEAGHIQPDEDIVLLLISHFALKNDEALKMWELAGYAQDKSNLISLLADDKGLTQVAYVASQDARILYTDIVHVNANKYGVVINFLQNMGINNQPMAISRIGMSHEHAQSLLNVLQKTMKLVQKRNIKDSKQK